MSKRAPQDLKDPGVAALERSRVMSAALRVGRIMPSFKATHVYLAMRLLELGDLHVTLIGRHMKDLADAGALAWEMDSSGHRVWRLA